MIDSHPYFGHTASLATRHGKWEQIAPPLQDCVGLCVLTVDVDTDALGTFAGEIPRVGTPLDTAFAKARMGMLESGCRLGVASEGTIGPHPAVPFLVADSEIVVFVDDDLGISVSETDTELGIPALALEIEADRWDEKLLVSAGFPEHGLIVRPKSGFDPVFKGIHDIDELRVAIMECARKGETSVVRIESDLRAHHHPSRQRVIARVAQRLARRLATLCPACSSPGWGIVRREAGAPCSLCGRRTHQLHIEHEACPRCEVTDAVVVSSPDGVDPMFCTRCNP